MKRILELARWIAYGLLLVVDGVIMIMSMASLGHRLEHAIGLGIIGAVLVLLMTWVFLKGIRAKGIERGIYLGAWALAVVLVVSLNWAFTRQNLFAQSERVTEQQETTAFEHRIRREQIESTQAEITALVEKLAKVNIWREADRKAIDDDLKTARERMDRLLEQKSEKTETVTSVSVFRKMSDPIKMTEEQTADLWWVLAFLLLQVLAVLAAPKGEEDGAAPKKKKRSAPKERSVDWSEWVTQWVKFNWVAVRTSKPGPRMILADEVFHEFVTSHWRAFPDWRHQQIKRAAQESGSLDGTTILIEDEAESVKKIIKRLDEKSMK
jgi:hypothetical protein